MFPGIEILIQKNNQLHTLKVGKPSIDKEKIQMHEYRYQVYRQYGLIEQNDALQDKDDYDNAATHVIATFDDQIVGSLRMIYENEIPMRDHYFKYSQDLPFEDQCIVEVGRIISTPYQVTDVIPRHFVLLAMFYYVMLLMEEMSFTMAVGAMKERVVKKLQQIRFPLIALKNYELAYNAAVHNDPLTLFFNENQSGKIIPVFCRHTSGRQFYKEIYDNSFIFDKLSERQFCLKSLARFNLFLAYKKMLGRAVNDTIYEKLLQKMGA